MMTGTYLEPLGYCRRSEVVTSSTNLYLASEFVCHWCRYKKSFRPCLSVIIKMGDGVGRLLHTVSYMKYELCFSLETTSWMHSPERFPTLLFLASSVSCRGCSIMSPFLFVSSLFFFIYRSRKYAQVLCRICLVKYKLFFCHPSIRNAEVLNRSRSQPSLD